MSRRNKVVTEQDEIIWRYRGRKVKISPKTN